MINPMIDSCCCVPPNQRAVRSIRLAICRAAIFLSLLLGHLAARADVNATIVGTVTDTTGAVIAGVRVTATNVATHVSNTALTNHDGVYNFTLPPATYEVAIVQTGFKTFRQSEIRLNVNDVITVNASLQVGSLDQVVQVTSAALQVDTASSQLGQVIEEQAIVAVPLNGRSYTDLLDLQPGVASGTSTMVGDSSNSFNFQSAGFRMPQISGEESPGNQSVNGMRETSNGFLLNGVSVEEYGFSGTAVVPNLDSLAEFRILTSNFDAEYGNFAGGQVNVITKGGTNRLHGNVFEFLRNTDFDAANYFDYNKRGPFQQNQFGGTAGGPIRKDHVFFFVDYQGTRNVVGVSTGTIAVPTAAERSGDFSAQAAAMSAATVQGDAWASSLSSRLGYAVTAGEPYYSPGCTTSTCVFPGAQIPTSAISPISTNILSAGAIPLGDGNGTFSTSADAQRLTDNKASGRVDANTHVGSLFGYYNIDQFTLLNPYPVATVPGFGANTTGRSQVVNAGDTKTIGSSAVNEARIGYLRVKDFLNTPASASKSLTSLGFAASTNPGGIFPLNPGIEGIPEMDFESFDIGVPSRVLSVIENTYQAADNFSLQVGKHSFKAGAAYHFTEVTEELNNVVNGYYFFDQTLETGVDFADFLIGAPGAFEQGEAPAADTRSYYFGLFGQDSWHPTSNLTLNYGLRWDVISPWWEKHNELEVLKLGEQSVKFPNSPQGWVFPGDPGIPRTVAPVRHNNFGPRVGLAWSPSTDSGLLHALLGGGGKSSIRAGYGMFYTAFEGGYDFSVIGDAPYGYFYENNGPSFANPYQTRATGAYNLNPFPYSFPPTNVSASNPDSNVPSSAFGVIGTSPTFNPANRVPYAEQYELSLQRQISGSDLLGLSYVGTQGHRLLVAQEANPVNEAACYALYLQNPTSPSCGPNAEPTSLRGPFGVNFGSEAYFSTVGASSYNAFQLNYQHTSKALQFLVGYTLSKSLDYASGFGEQVNPFNPKLSRALSSFDQRQNFVVSYSYTLPTKVPGVAGKLLNGWQLSGITNFSKGLPVFIFENDDNSLLGTDNSGPMPIGIDTPNYAGGAIHNLNPRSSGHPYFDKTQFSQEPIGQLGSSRRSFFAGAGLNNFDTALLKSTEITERIKLEFRAEFFNVFNHTQFANIDGNFNSSTFGEATTAGDPRIGQLALKLAF